MVEVGSRSQDPMEFSTNFCLDTFLDVGIKQPQDMIVVAEHGITPFHAYHTRKAGRRVSQMKTDTLIAAVEQHYGKKFSPIKEVVPGLQSNHFETYKPRGTSRTLSWEVVMSQRLSR